MVALVAESIPCPNLTVFVKIKKYTMWCVEKDFYLIYAFVHLTQEGFITVTNIFIITISNMFYKHVWFT